MNLEVIKEERTPQHNLLSVIVKVDGEKTFELFRNNLGMWKVYELEEKMVISYKRKGAA